MIAFDELVDKRNIDLSIVFMPNLLLFMVTVKYSLLIMNQYLFIRADIFVLLLLIHDFQSLYDIRFQKDLTTS